jgi:predicted XRE-type DNA-binding protein
MTKTKITKGSGNVFADIGVRDPQEALAKADVAGAIIRMIRDQGLTQTRAAEILGIDQPRVSALTKGRLRLFSLEKLLAFASKLGTDVEIQLKLPVAQCSHSICGQIRVVHAGNPWNMGWLSVQAAQVTCVAIAPPCAGATGATGEDLFANPPPPVAGYGDQACPPFQ